MAAMLYRDRRLLALVIALIVALGASAYFALPRMEDPATRERWAWVLVRFPGASAGRVESLVTEKVEQRLRELEAIKTIESQSSAGIAAIVVKLKDEVVDVDTLWSRLRDKLEEVEPELPPGALKPEFVGTEWHSNTLIVALTWELEQPVAGAVLDRWGKEWRNRLRFVRGTMHARLYGTVPEEVLVDVDPERLAAVGLDPARLMATIARSDAKGSAGVVRSPASQVLLEVEGEIDSLDRLRRLPVRHDETTGGVLRLGDIGIVRKTALDPPRERTVVDGGHAVVLALRMEPGYDLDRWTGDVRAAIDDLRGQLPEGLGTRVLFDQSRYTRGRLDQLKVSFAIGACLVIAILLAMMGHRAVVPVSAALPLTVLVVLAGMRLFAIPIHQMSMAGMIMALGLLIDNAIIMYDAIRKRIEDGRSPEQSIAASVRLLAWPLTGSTLTTMLAFTPLLLLPGAVGEFLSGVAFTVVLSLGASLLLAMTVVPALCAHFGRSSTGRGHGVGSPRLYRLYRFLLNGMLRHPLVGIVLGIILPVAGLASISGLEERFFPPAERDQFQVELWLSPQATLQQTQAVALRAREVMLEHPAVENVHWFLGTSAPKFYHNLVPGKEDRAYYAQGLVQLRGSAGSLAVVRELQEALDAALPTVQSLAHQIEQGPPVAAPVELRIYGTDLDELYRLGESARERLARVPNVTHTQATVVHGLPKFRLEIDEETQRLVRLDSVGLSERLDAGLEGIVGGSLQEATEELPIRVRFRSAARHRSEVETLTLLGTAGKRRLPLNVLGGMQLVPEVASISRRNGLRCNRVLGFVRAGVLAQPVASRFQEILAEDELAMPAGYRLEFGGEAEERNAAVEQLLAHVDLLVVLIATVLVLLFRSFRLALVVGAVGALSLPLAFLALGLTGYPVGLVALVGALGMVGVAINDSIVVLAAIRNNDEALRGDASAVARVVFDETRHVLTTSLTTAIGFLPLAFLGGELWKPMAVVMVLGMSGATIIALTFVPCAYALLVRSLLPSVRRT
jgi:multidrug efflux pump subunit AcrB